MFRRGLAAFAAVAAILVVGSSVASGQENPVLDLDSVQPVIPYSVAQQLAAAESQLPSVGPGPDHPWVPNNAPFPLNITYVTGSYRNANGSTTVVYCLLDVAAEHPYWYYGNMLRTLAVGGARCTVRLAEEAGGGMTGTVRALSWPSRSQLASASLGGQHQVPEGQGSGWQAYGVATFDRASANSNQQVQLEARLVLPAWPGWTNIGWNSFGPGCARGASAREVNCQFSSPPFQTLPYPCPNGSVGAQPPGCTDTDELDEQTDELLADSLSPTEWADEAIVSCADPASDAVGQQLGDEQETDAPSTCGDVAVIRESGTKYYVGRRGHYGVMKGGVPPTNSSTNHRVSTLTENWLRVGQYACANLHITNKSGTRTKQFTGGCGFPKGTKVVLGDFAQGSVKGVAWCDGHPGGSGGNFGEPIRGKCRYEWIASLT